MADNADPTQYDPNAQAMEEIHFDWRCIVCCMVALSPFTWNNSISLALNLCILTWTTPYGLNVISATPHSTYNVVPGSHWPLSGTSTSFALFSAAESFNTCRSMPLDYLLPILPSWNVLASVYSRSENTCSRSTSMSLVLKMAWKRLCSNSKNSTPAKKKKKPAAAAKKTPPLTMTTSETAHHSDSAHKNKKIGLFTADEMRECITEINFYEQRQKNLGPEKPE